MRRGGLVSALLVAGGFAVLPVGAIAQTPTPAPEPAPPAAETAVAAPDAVAAETPVPAESASTPGCPRPTGQETPEDAAAQAPEGEVPAEAEAEVAADASESDGPTAHCAQNAGDEQYEDPFANVKPPGEKDGQGGNGTAQQQGSDAASSLQTTAPSGTDDFVDGESAGTTAEGEALPNTGLGLPVLLALGLLLFAAGVRLRRAQT